MSKQIPCRRSWIAGGILLTSAIVIALFWDAGEAAWLRLHFRGRYESFAVWSHHVGDTFTIHVYLPRGYDPGRAYPAILALDGDSDARPMAGAVTQQDLDAIVLGIGYGSREADARERDYTPFAAPEIDWAPSGGGAAFYAFLTEELLPEVEARYHTLGAAHRVLAGHSLAGLAAVYALLRSSAGRPHLSGYIAASPTLPLQRGTIFDLESDLAEEGDNVTGVLYLSMGSRESHEMRQAMARLAVTLRRRAYPDLTVHTAVRCGRGHGGNNWQSYVDGVRLMHACGIV